MVAAKIRPHFLDEKFLGNFQKPIDILITVWYNNNVPRGEGNKDVPRKALADCSKKYVWSLRFHLARLEKIF